MENLHIDSTLLSECRRPSWAPLLCLTVGALLVLTACSGARRTPVLTQPKAVSLDEEATRHGWQRPDWIIEQMNIQPGSRIVDLGAGTGYLLPWLARAVGSSGRVYATDIQPEMLRELRSRCARDGLNNVVVLPSTATEVGLPELVDRAILLHSYRELSDPVELLGSLKASLQPTGRVFIVEFLPAPDPAGLPLPLPPAAQRLDPETVEAEARGAGLIATRRFVGLPHQSFAMFVPVEALEPAPTLEPASGATPTGTDD